MFNFKEWFYLTEDFENPKTYDILIKQATNIDKAIQRGFDPNKKPYVINLINKMKDKPKKYSQQRAFQILHRAFPQLDPSKKNKTKDISNIIQLSNLTEAEKNLVIFLDKHAIKKEEIEKIIQQIQERLKGKLSVLIVDDILTFSHQYENNSRAFEPITFDGNVESLTTQIYGVIHYFQAIEKGDYDPGKNADPKMLAQSFPDNLLIHKNNIWIFIANNSTQSRKFGKNQEWCISSSDSRDMYNKYRFKNHQTQFFIFDFNKPLNDPTRYTNPGVAPEGHYTEWVDARNHPNKIKGYTSVDDYKQYLAKQLNLSVNELDNLLKPIPFSENEIAVANAEANLELLDESTYEKLSIDEKIHYFSVIIENSLQLPDNQIDDLWKICKKTLEADQAIYFLDNSRTINKDELVNTIVAKINSFTMESYSSLMTSLIDTATNKDEIINKLLPLAINHLDEYILEAILENCKNKDKMIETLWPHVEQLLHQAKVVYNLVEYSGDKNKMIRKILPYFGDTHYADIVEALLDHDGIDKEIHDEILNFNKDKMHPIMVRTFMKRAENKEEKLNQIMPLLQHKLHPQNVKALMEHAPNKEKLFDEIVPKVDVLVPYMVNALLSGPNHNEYRFNQLFPKTLEELHNAMITDLFTGAITEQEIDHRFNKIIEQIHDVIDPSDLRSFLAGVKNKDAMIDRLLPYIQTKLNNEMIKILISNCSDEVKIFDQIQPYVKKWNESKIVALVEFSKNKKSIIQKFLPLFNDNFSSQSLITLTNNSEGDVQLIDRIFYEIKDHLDVDVFDDIFIFKGTKYLNIISDIAMKYVKNQLNTALYSSFLEHADNKEAVIKSYLPILKNKFDIRMLSITLAYAKDNISLIGIVINAIKPELDEPTILNLLMQISDKVKLQIIPFIRDELSYNVIEHFVKQTNTQQRFNIIMGLLPYIKEKLNSNIIVLFVKNLPWNQLQNQFLTTILPYVIHNPDKEILDLLLDISVNKEALQKEINRLT